MELYTVIVFFKGKTLFAIPRHPAKYHNVRGTGGCAALAKWWLERGEVVDHINLYDKEDRFTGQWRPGTPITRNTQGI